jgi:hypothetical protein
MEMIAIANMYLLKALSFQTILDIIFIFILCPSNNDMALKITIGLLIDRY